MNSRQKFAAIYFASEKTNTINSWNIKNISSQCTIVKIYTCNEYITNISRSGGKFPITILKNTIIYARRIETCCSQRSIPKRAVTNRFRVVWKGRSKINALYGFVICRIVGPDGPIYNLVTHAASLGAGIGVRAMTHSAASFEQSLQGLCAS